MDNNFRYFNAFFIIIILTSLIGAFKYFFYDNPNKESFHKDPYKKILQKNYFSHILYICDNYFFVQNKKIECNKEKEEYLFLIEKLFNIIEETLKYKLEIISINLMSLTDLTLMPPEEIKNIINNKKLWKIIQKNANKMNINIRFIYNNLKLHPQLIKIFKKLEKKINHKKQYTTVNFIFGYDLFEDIHKNIENAINKYENKSDILAACNLRNIQKTLLGNIPPIDVAIVFENGLINDSMLLHMQNTKIINVNYSLKTLSKKIIDLLLKKILINIDPFI